MKVILVNAMCGLGSTGRIVSDIWALLKQQGHEAKVAYGIGTPLRVSPDDTICLNNKMGYYIHNAVSRLTDRAGFYSIGASQKLIRVINEYQPDVIHLHNLHGYYLNVQVLFEYLAKVNIPVVWTLHDCWALTGHCAHFSFVKCEKWLNGCRHCPQLAEYPKSYLLDRSERNYNDKKRLFTALDQMMIITPSEWLASVVRRSYLSRYIVKAIPNGIDLGIFKPKPSNFKDCHSIRNKKMILAVSNVWNEKKGMNDVFSLSEKLDKEEYQVVMVGLTDKQLSLVPDSIIAICRTNSVEELAEIYSAADVFINPSYEETMGLVTVEALACGTPAVVYDQTAVPEIIDGTCGLIIKAGDIDALAGAISKVCAMHFSACRDRAKQYEKNKQYKMYLDVYQEIRNDI